jgi:hypothetical protein
MRRPDAGQYAPTTSLPARLPGACQIARSMLLLTEEREATSFLDFSDRFVFQLTSSTLTVRCTASFEER